MSDRLSMPEMNRVILAGRLTMDPDHLVLPSGQERTRLRLACNRRFRNRQGDLQSEEGFFSVVVWNRVASLCKEYLKKASPVLVEGRLHQSRWVTDGGESRDAIEVVATRVHFLGRPIEDAVPEFESVESEVAEA